MNPTRQQCSEAVDPLGWRYVLGALHTHIAVPPEQARGRIEAALAAGGRLVSADAAPAFWVLADAEGNEACVCTWQGRD